MSLILFPASLFAFVVRPLACVTDVLWSAALWFINAAARLSPRRLAANSALTTYARSIFTHLKRLAFLARDSAAQAIDLSQSWPSCADDRLRYRRLRIIASR